MVDAKALYDEMRRIKARLALIEPERDQLRTRATEIVEALLRAEEPPTKVADESPFSSAHVRTIRQQAGIPPGRPGVKPRRRQGEPG